MGFVHKSQNLRLFEEPLLQEVSRKTVGRVLGVREQDLPIFQQDIDGDWTLSGQNPGCTGCLEFTKHPEKGFLKTHLVWILQFRSVSMTFGMSFFATRLQPIIVNAKVTLRKTLHMQRTRMVTS